MKPYVITIARQYGSGGKTVGKMLDVYKRQVLSTAPMTTVFIATEERPCAVMKPFRPCLLYTSR